MSLNLKNILLNSSPRGSWKRALVFVFVFVSLSLSAQNLFVGTYNIRNNSDNGDVENGNGWNQRVGVICGQINFEQPDVFGTQEVLHQQVLDLKAGLPGYDYIGVGRDDGKEDGEYECIWYNTNRLQLLDNGNFWLNETPDRPALGWDAACIRICTWGKFKVKGEKKGKTFFYFNLHMDHVGNVARREAAKLVMKMIPQIAGNSPVILTGDFNVDQTDGIYQTFTGSGFLKDSYECTKQRFAQTGTFNTFNPEMWTRSRIDHIFVSASTTVNHYAIMTNGYWTERTDEQMEQLGKDAPREIRFKRHQLRTASDHYPVWAKITL